MSAIPADTYAIAEKERASNERARAILERRGGMDIGEARH
jgi:hypothetical protein